MGSNPPPPNKSRRKSRKHGLRWKLAVALLGPILSLAIRLLWKSLRVQAVIGEENLDRLSNSAEPFIPCCWHQQLFACVCYLTTRKKRGGAGKLGLVISPSRDGELAARVMARFDLAIIRGSANRTGAQTLREMHQQITKGRISPFIQPDGPTGPARHFKEGTMLLAQWTGAPFLPMAYAADRYWQVKSWDRHLIPKPFARIVIAIGEARWLEKAAKADAIEAVRLQLEQELDGLIDMAETGL